MLFRSINFISPSSSAVILLPPPLPHKGERPPLSQNRISRQDATPTAAGWHADYTISRRLLEQDSVFFFGVEKQEFLPDGKIIFMNDRNGDFIHEYRLYLDSFSADKLRRIILKNN